MSLTCWTVRVVVEQPAAPTVPLRMIVTRRTAKEARAVAQRIALDLYRGSSCSVDDPKAIHGASFHPGDLS